MSGKLSTFISQLFGAIAQASLEDIARTVAMLGTLGVTLYLFALGRPVPNDLSILLGGFVGYFFGRVATISTGSAASPINVPKGS